MKKLLLFGLSTFVAFFGGAAELRCEVVGVDATELVSMVTDADGELLEPFPLRIALRAAVRRFDLVELQLIDGGSGPILSGRARSRIGAIDIEGELGARRRWWLRHQLGVQVGDPLPSELETLRDRVESRFSALGFRHAEINLAIRAGEGGLSRLLIEVFPGEPTQLESLVVEGVDEQRWAELESRFSGEVLSDRRIDKIRRELTRAVAGEGFWRARVDDSVLEGGVLSLELDKGPHFTLEHGPLEASPELSDRMGKLVGKAIDDRLDLGPVAADFVTDLEETILGRLIATGRTGATVRVEDRSELDQERVRLWLQIRPGPEDSKPKLEVGTSPELDHQALYLELERSPKILRKEGLATLVDRSRIWLRRQGFIEPRPYVERIPIGDEVLWLLHPEPGPRRRLAAVEILGLPSELVGIRAEDLGLIVGSGLDPVAIESARRRLEIDLRSAGYPDAKVRGDLAGEERARLTLDVEAGVFASIEAIEIAVAEAAKRRFLTARLERHGIEPGRPVDSVAINRAIADIARFGLYRRLALSPLPGQSSEDSRRLVLEAEPARRRSWSLGLGWDTEAGFVLSPGWSDLDLFGRAWALSAQARLSDREERAQISIRHLDPFGWDVPFWAAAYSTQEDFRTFAQERAGVWAELGDRRARPWRWWLRTEYQSVRPDEPQEVDSRTDLEIELFSISLAAEIDTRDDPLTPRRGLLAGLELQLARPLLKAEQEYDKVLGRFALYQPLGPRLNLDFAVRLGGILPKSGDPLLPDNERLPIAVRFFAGGRVSHRAFELDTLGVLGQTLDSLGEPTGGAAQALFNVELRRLFGSSFEVVLFVDGGNVFADVDSVDVQELRWGAGLGLRYLTPVGPIRLEYGHKLDRLEGERIGEVFLSLGSAF